MNRNTYAEIDLGAVADNFNSLRHLFGNANFICPMVKANAYGHGDIEVSKALEQNQAKYLGVCLIEEGVRLRSAGIAAKILNFGIFEKSGVPELEHFKITPVLSTWEQVAALEECVSAPLDVHLKLDTGMHRLGFDLADAEELAEHFATSKKMRLTGICTHLITGSDLGDKNGLSEKQISDFRNVLPLFAKWKPIVHVLNSSGTINACGENAEGNSQYLDLGSRPGISIYGLRSTQRFPDLNLRPVMSLRTEVVRWVHVPKGETVSYDGTWKAPGPAIVGVLPIGYADGYSRFLSNKGEVLFRGARVPVVGRVCMDYIMFDATAVLKSPGASPEQSFEEIILLGEQKGPAGFSKITADDWAAKAGTISYEVLTQVSSRVPRLFKFGSTAL